MELTLKQTDDSGYPERKPIPDNTFFEAVLLDVEQKESIWDVDENDPSKGKKMQLSWKFEIIDPSGEFDKRYVWGNTSTYFSTAPNNKLRQWIQAVLDMPTLPEGYAVNTNDLHGKQVLVVIQAKEKASGGISNRVKELQPSRAAAPMAAVANGTDTTQSAAPATEYLDEEPF